MSSSLLLSVRIFQLVRAHLQSSREPSPAAARPMLAVPLLLAVPCRSSI